MNHPKQKSNIQELATVSDWSVIQGIYYDNEVEYNKMINDHSPITAFIEYLQKTYPNGILINTQ